MSAPIRVLAPTRVDLAGGTLDIWPLCHLLERPARTVNVALDLAAEVIVTPRDDGMVEIVSEDRGEQLRYPVGQPPAERLALATGLVEAMAPGKALHVSLKSHVPRQSGLGGSSALAVALGAALVRLAGEHLDATAFLRYLQNFETRLLGLPTGYQDYYPGVFGSVQTLTATFDGVQRESLAGSSEFVAQHLLLVDTRLDHESGMNNWEVVRAFLDREQGVRASLNRINRCAYRMDAAVRSRDLEATAAALDDEWQARRTLAPVVSNERIEALIAAARGAGALAGKVCGAGGGGCIAFVAIPDRHAAIRAAIEAEGGAVLAFGIDECGLDVS
ncbi:MAG: GHMP family kinase ATP-binding protein [Planctomycetota bacterium]|jgi:D-glycero-alpha-D-manno-heptose-7-phosphate kinase